MTAGIVFLIGRIMFAYFFAVAAMGHVTRGEMMVGYARARGSALAGAGGRPASIWLALGVVSIVFGVCRMSARSCSRLFPSRSVSGCPTCSCRP